MEMKHFEPMRTDLLRRITSLYDRRKGHGRPERNWKSYRKEQYKMPTPTPNPSEIRVALTQMGIAKSRRPEKGLRIAVFNFITGQHKRIAQHLSDRYHHNFTTAIRTHLDTGVYL